MEQIEETRRQVKRSERALIWLAVAFAILLIVPGAAGFQVAPIYFLGTVAALPPGAALVWASIHLKRFKALLRLRESWGNPVKKERDFTVIASLYQRLDSGSAQEVDEQTWLDLDLDRIYAMLDRTMTAEGQAVLYRILKTPCYTPEPLEERDAILRVFQEDAPFREEMQLALLHLEGRSDKDLTELLWGHLPPPSPLLPLYHILAIAAMLSPLSILLLGAQGALLIIGLFGLNIFVHHRVSRHMAHMLPGISSLAALLRTAQKLARVEKRPELGERQDQLQQAALACKP